MNWLEIGSGELDIAFSERSCGLPDLVRLRTENGCEEILQESYLELELADGRIARPRMAAPERFGNKVIFSKLHWVDQHGEEIAHFYSSFEHEFLDDGTLFSTGFFCAERLDMPEIVRFELVKKLCFDAFPTLKWGLLHRPEISNGALIQLGAPDRFLDRGDDRKEQHGIFPVVNFNLKRADSTSLYVEFFVEGDNTLSTLKSENSSQIRWRNGNPELVWNFQNAPCRKPYGLITQWRNQWGWAIASPMRKRQLPPMTIYHYLDADGFPSHSQLEALAAARCDILILHECWRLDVQNGGMPDDAAKLAETIEFARKHHIRLALYMRGNEDAAIENACDWFLRYLRRDFDGLYMDYGGAFTRITLPDENNQNGRVNFRKHYQTLRRLRETVGKEGIFFSHTGPWFSAVGQRFTDGYVSGEGERGILIQGRMEHEYFSMASVNHGTMWTAAFPEYSSVRMIPFLAASGQSPHQPIGTQLPSCSLSHPDFPGMSDQSFQPLWNIWRMFRDERNLSVFNDYNCSGIFHSDSPDSGHYLMVAADGGRALLIVTNFSSEARSFTLHTRWEKTGFTGNAPEKECFNLPPCGVDFRLYSDDEASLQKMDSLHDCANFNPGHHADEWIEHQEEQRRRRENPPAWAQCFLSVRVPQSANRPYEDALIIDLYLNEMELLELLPDGREKSFGKIDRNGLSEGAYQTIMPGQASTPIALHQLLPPGRHHLRLKSLHAGEPFYSFVILTLSNGIEHYEIEFHNALEPDRANLNWIQLIG